MRPRMNAATPRRVLVTGAAGNLGRAVCTELSARGHEVKGTDRRYHAEHAGPFVPGDLLDEFFVHEVLKGCDSVVHLGNHPNRFAGPSDQRLLAENTQMNANVFLAAIELGIQNIVFASSIQTMLRAAGSKHPPPYPIPHLPIDGRAPADPGQNPYALSKLFAERLLETQCQHRPELCATALRFPMLPLDFWVKNLTGPRGVELHNLNLGECLAHLLLPDAARLVALVIAQPKRGYHQYLPAVSTEIEGLTTAELIAEFYPDIPLTAGSDLDSLIDVSALTHDFGWVPEGRMRVRLHRS